MTYDSGILLEIRKNISVFLCKKINIIKLQYIKSIFHYIKK
jgi:hypothetical protein